MLKSKSLDSLESLVNSGNLASGNNRKLPDPPLKEDGSNSDIDPSDLLVPADQTLDQDHLYSKTIKLTLDENQDFDDEKWLSKKLSKFKISKDYQKGTLSCALCFTPVSFYFSRYILIINSRLGNHQYETAYIENCEILKDVIQRDTSDDSIYHPVKCIECDLEIGLVDTESITHFYQVIAS